MTTIEPEIKVIRYNSLDFHLRLEIAGADLVIEDMDIDVEFIKTRETYQTTHLKSFLTLML